MKPALGPDEIRALLRAAAYPDDPSAAGGAERVQTHISDVFLTAERVYKFRKAVDLGFLCFTARDERNADCLREVSLNRRLAPDVYLGVAPLLGAGEAARVGPAAEELAGSPGSRPEHCVVMRRLPAGRDLLSLLEAGALPDGAFARLARRVAHFHDGHGLGAPAPFTPEAWLERCTGPARETLDVLERTTAGATERARVVEVARASGEFAQQHAGRFEARRRAGRAVDGHGDLHLQHVWFETDAAEPLVIDCLEFDEGLRCIDAAADVAFTAMDLVYRGHEGLAERFLRIYAAARDDFDLYGVVDFFAAYRAAVRAKVAALAAADAGIAQAQREAALGSAGRHLALAGRLLAPRSPGPLVLVAGTVGTGKTTLAAELAEAAGGVVIASDSVRKRLAGLAAGEPGPAELYTPEAKAVVYAGLLERAAPVLGSGRPVVLDATWSRRADRDAASALARKLGATLRVVQATCAPEVARERLATRRALGGDASDAGPERLAASLASFDAPGPDEAGWERLATDEAGWRERAAALARRIAGVARADAPQD